MIKPSNAPFERPNADHKTAKYVILKGITAGNQFFTLNSPNEDQTLLANGKKVYNIIGYANTMAEAQMYLYGRVSTELED